VRVRVDAPNGSPRLGRGYSVRIRTQARLG
jgi:hypothetical protein